MPDQGIRPVHLLFIVAFLALIASGPTFSGHRDQLALAASGECTQADRNGAIVNNDCQHVDRTVEISGQQATPTVKNSGECTNENIERWSASLDPALQQKATDCKAKIGTITYQKPDGTIGTICTTCSGGGMVSEGKGLGGTPISPYTEGPALSNVGPPSPTAPDPRIQAIFDATFGKGMQESADGTGADTTGMGGLPDGSDTNAGSEKPGGYLSIGAGLKNALLQEKTFSPGSSQPSYTNNSAFNDAIPAFTPSSVTGFTSPQGTTIGDSSPTPMWDYSSPLGSESALSGPGTLSAAEVFAQQGPAFARYAKTGSAFPVYVVDPGGKTIAVLPGEKYGLEGTGEIVVAAPHLNGSPIGMGSQAERITNTLLTGPQQTIFSQTNGDGHTLAQDIGSIINTNESQKPWYTKMWEGLYGGPDTLTVQGEITQNGATTNFSHYQPIIGQSAEEYAAQQAALRSAGLPGGSTGVPFGSDAAHLIPGQAGSQSGGILQQLNQQNPSITAMQQQGMKGTQSGPAQTEPQRAIEISTIPEWKFREMYPDASQPVPPSNPDPNPYPPYADKSVPGMTEVADYTEIPGSTPYSLPPASQPVLNQQNPLIAQMQQQGAKGSQSGHVDSNTPAPAPVAQAQNPAPKEIAGKSQPTPQSAPQTQPTRQDQSPQPQPSRSSGSGGSVPSASPSFGSGGGSSPAVNPLAFVQAIPVSELLTGLSANTPHVAPQPTLNVLATAQPSPFIVPLYTQPTLTPSDAAQTPEGGNTPQETQPSFSTSNPTPQEEGSPTPPPRTQPTENRPPSMHATQDSVPIPIPTEKPPQKFSSNDAGTRDNGTSGSNSNNNGTGSSAANKLVESKTPSADVAHPDQQASSTPTGSANQGSTAPQPEQNAAQPVMAEVTPTKSNLDKTVEAIKDAVAKVAYVVNELVGIQSAQAEPSRSPQQLRYNLWGIYAGGSGKLTGLVSQQVCIVGGRDCGYATPADAVAGYLGKVKSYYDYGAKTPLSLGSLWVSGNLTGREDYGAKAAQLAGLSPNADLSTVESRVRMMMAQACIEQGFCAYEPGAPKSMWSLRLQFPYSTDDIRSGIAKAYGQQAADAWQPGSIAHTAVANVPQGSAFKTFSSALDPNVKPVQSQPQKPSAPAKKPPQDYYTPIKQLIDKLAAVKSLGDQAARESDPQLGLKAASLAKPIVDSIAQLARAEAGNEQTSATDAQILKDAADAAQAAATDAQARLVAFNKLPKFFASKSQYSEQGNLKSALEGDKKKGEAAIDAIKNIAIKTSGTGDAAPLPSGAPSATATAGPTSGVQAKLQQFADAQKFAFGRTGPDGKTEMLSPKDAAKLSPDERNKLDVYRLQRDGTYQKAGSVPQYLAQQKAASEAAMKNASYDAQLNNNPQAKALAGGGALQTEGASSVRPVFTTGSDGVHKQVGIVHTVSDENARILAAAQKQGIHVVEKNGKLFDDKGRALELRNEGSKMVQSAPKQQVLSSPLFGGKVVKAAGVPLQRMSHEDWVSALQNAGVKVVDLSLRLPVASNLAWSTDGTRVMIHGDVSSGDKLVEYEMRQLLAGKIAAQAVLKEDGTLVILKRFDTGAFQAGSSNRQGFGFETAGADNGREATDAQFEVQKKIVDIALAHGIEVGTHGMAEPGHRMGNEGGMRIVAYIYGNGPVLSPQVGLYGIDAAGQAQKIGDTMNLSDISGAKGQTTFESTDQNGKPDGKVQFALQETEIGTVTPELSVDENGNLGVVYTYTPPPQPETPPVPAPPTPMQRAMDAFRNFFGNMFNQQQMPQSPQGGGGGAGSGGGGSRGGNLPPPIPPTPQGQAILSCSPYSVETKATSTPITVSWNCPSGSDTQGFGFETSGKSGGTITFSTTTAAQSLSYALLCSTKTQAPQNVTCTTRILHPVAALIANPATIDPHASATLMWASVDTQGCQLYDSSNTLIASGGSQGQAQTGALTQSSIFVLVCESAHGLLVQASTTVRVVDDSSTPLSAASGTMVQ